MIIGITGTNGAGKGTVVEYLVTQKGFKHLSVRKYIEEEIVRREMPLNRESMNTVGNDMRKRFGFDYWDNLILGDMAQAQENIVFESVRNLASAKKLRAQGVLLWGVDAEKRLRYERIIKRGSDTDQVSFEQFCEQEDKEMSQTAEHDMNVFGVMQMADVVLTNNGTPQELFAQVEEALKTGDNAGVATAGDRG